MYDKTITLFNYYESKQSDTYLWYPTVLHNVDLNVDKAAILAKYGEQSQDNSILHVRDPNGAKPWLPPKAWGEQVNELLPETMTFRSGDLFWMGEWPSQTPIDDNEYIDGFEDYLARKYDFVFRISTVGGPFSLIPHFEILGR